MRSSCQPLAHHFLQWSICNHWYTSVTSVLMSSRGYNDATRLWLSVFRVWTIITYSSFGIIDLLKCRKPWSISHIFVHADSDKGCYHIVCTFLLIIRKMWFNADVCSKKQGFCCCWGFNNYCYQWCQDLQLWKTLRQTC